MSKGKTVILLSLLTVLCLLCGCLISRLLKDSMAHRQEQYCVVSLPPSGYTTLNANLYDLSHAYNMGIYILDDMAPGALNHAGEALFSKEGYALQVLDAYSWLDYYEDYVVLAIGNNIFAPQKGGAVFADIATGGKAGDILTEEVCSQLENAVIEALNEAMHTRESETEEATVSEDEYRAILYDYLESLKPYLDGVFSLSQTPLA